MKDEPFLTSKEVANRLRVSLWTVGQWIRAGKLKAFRAGHQWRIRQSDLDAFLSRR